MCHDVARLCRIFAVEIKQKYNMKRKTIKQFLKSVKNQQRTLIKKELFCTPRKIHPEDAWNIKVDMAKFLVPRLKMFLKEIDKVGATPGILARQYPDDGHERWREIVKKMLFSFEYYAYVYNHWMDMDTDENEQRRVEEGLFLFAEWYDHLWV